MGLVGSEASSIRRHCPVRRIGPDEGHYFFGYYNKQVWDPSGRYLLANHVPTRTADLTGAEVAEVGFFDLGGGEIYHAVGSTTAWNWQMGCQLQWLEGKDGRQVIYNTRSATPGRADTVYPDFRSIVRHLDSGEDRELPLPIYVVAPNSEYALCVDYSRFRVTHPTIGYAASGPEGSPENAPEDDGIHRMDIDSGETELILSLRDLCESQPLKSMDRAIHWVTHLEINPSSGRFLFIHRWTERVEDETCFLHRLFTMNPDGTDLKLLECTDHPLPQLSGDFDPNVVGTFDYEKSEYQISHPAWKDDRHIIVWGPHAGRIHYHLYDEQSGSVEIVGARCLTENGHMTYSPDWRWLLSDTYPDATSNERQLILYQPESGKRYDIGSFYTDPALGKPNRCDLHPRWSRDGSQVCIDSIHESARRMYIIDVSTLTGES